MGRDRVLLFDLFGTLVLPVAERLPILRIGDREVRSTLASLSDLLAHYAPGVEPGAFWRALAAVSEEIVRRRAFEPSEEPSRVRFRRALERVGVAAAACREGGAALARAHHRALGTATDLPAAHGALLDELRSGYRLAIVSNFDDTASAYEILHRHGILDRVEAVVVSEALGVRKPHPLMVRTALRLLDAAPESALLVGDTFAEDIEGAHAAGVDAAWIDSAGAGVPAGARPPRFVLGALTELRDALRAAC